MEWVKENSRGINKRITVITHKKDIVYSFIRLSEIPMRIKRTAAHMKILLAIVVLINVDKEKFTDYPPPFL